MKHLHVHPLTCSEKLLFAHVPLATFMLCRVVLPDSVNLEFSVYNDLETAEARMILPSKLREFPLLDLDAAAASATDQPELLPECVGVNEVCCSAYSLPQHSSLGKATCFSHDMPSCCLMLHILLKYR